MQKKIKQQLKPVLIQKETNKPHTKKEVVKSTIVSKSDTTTSTSKTTNESEPNSPISKVIVKKKKELPFLPGCEPDGEAALEMIAKYPDIDTDDIVRYLVARKGSVQDASDMLDKVNEWRAKHFPLKKADMKPAIETGCMFAHGVALDKSPVIYFRYVHM